MKKLLKLLLASTMVLSLAACSSDDEEDPSSDPEPEVEDPDWKEHLDGVSESDTAYFGDDLVDIIIQLEDNITIRFYYDQEAQENYSSIVIPFGTLDEETFFDNLLLTDYDDDGYDDLEFLMNDNNQNVIEVRYHFDTEYKVYTLDEFDTLDGEPDAEYVDTWYLNADTNQNTFTLNDTGNWMIANTNGESLQTGIAYEASGFVDLYNDHGEYIGDIELEDNCLLVTIDDTTEYYYHADNSTAQ